MEKDDEKKNSDRWHTNLASAAKLFARAASSFQDSSEQDVALFSICFDGENTDYDPPQLGVVLSVDLETYFEDPSQYEDGISSFLNPTLYEDYDFPVGAEFPAVEMIDQEAMLQPPAGGVAARVRALVERVNRRRSSDSPPFVAVDFSGDATAHIDTLPPDLRHRLLS